MLLFFNMKRILVIGAGRSSANLIKYLTEYAAVEDWMVRVGDMDVDFARQKIGNCRRAEAFLGSELIRLHSQARHNERTLT